MQGKQTMRWLSLAAAGFFLSGCALPPIISVVSIAADFASYGATGKTVTDHGISLVLQQDCAMLRALDGPICFEESESETAIASLETGDDAEAGSLFAPRDLAYLQEEGNRVMLISVAAPEAAIVRPVSSDALGASGYLGAGYLGQNTKPLVEASLVEALLEETEVGYFLENAEYLADAAAHRRSLRVERQPNG